METASPARRMRDNRGRFSALIVPMSDSPSADAAATLKSLPTDMELVLKVIPMPADCNANGDIFGGWVMAQCDLAGSVIPARYAKGRAGDGGGQRIHLQAAGAHGRHPVLLFEAGAHRAHLDHRDGRRSLPSASGPRASTSR